MFCPKCGGQQPDGSHFCRHCGTNLSLVSSAMSGTAPGQRYRASGSGGTTLAVFHPATISNENQPLDGHSAAAVFGAAIIDLTAQPLPEGEIRISVYSIFGAIDVLVSDDVGVRVTGVSLFSGIKVRGHDLGNGIFSVNEYTTPGYASAVRRVHIDATSIFGGIKIRR